MATSRTGKDACDLLDADHRAIKKMFKDYEVLAGSRARGAALKKQVLARQICSALTVHTQIEEELFYPALQAVIKSGALVDEAAVQHGVLRELVAQIQQSEDEPLTDVRVRVLGEYMDHHVKKERTELFAKARAARKLDLVALREQLDERKETLMTEMADQGELVD